MQDIMREIMRDGTGRDGTGRDGRDGRDGTGRDKDGTGQGRGGLFGRAAKNQKNGHSNTFLLKRDGTGRENERE